MDGKRTLLFVDDEPNVLAGLRRTFRPHRDDWNFLFAEGAKVALSVLSKRYVDVVVTDMRMPNVDGAQLLKIVQDRYPTVIRVMLSGQSDEESIQQSITRSHQYFTKPCDPIELFDAVNRSCVLRDRIVNSSIQALVSRTSSLPSIPKIYSQVVEELKSPNACLRTVADLVAQDVAMSAKLLQLVNSSFFALKGKVESPAQAAALLGINLLRPIVLTVGIFSQFNVREESQFSLEAFSDHSMAVGKVAELIARDVGAEKQVIDDSQMAGLVHDVGQLLLASRLPEEYDQLHTIVCTSDADLLLTEEKFFGTTHHAIGAHLLGLWGLPQDIVEAVACHRNPRDITTNEFTPLVAVHVANALINQTNLANPIERSCDLDEQWLKDIGYEEQLEVWRALVGSTLCEEMAHE